MARKKKQSPTIGVGGMVIRQACERLGWSLDDLAHHSGLPSPSLYKHTIGTRRRMTHATALVLSRTLTDAGYPVTSSELRGQQ